MLISNVVYPENILVFIAGVKCMMQRQNIFLQPNPHFAFLDVLSPKVSYTDSLV